MPSPSVVAVSGSLVAPSRTRALVDHVTTRIAGSCAIDLETYDLTEIGRLIAPITARKGLAAGAARIYDAIEAADLLVVGSPIYKASYSGLFKHLFDLVDPSALSGVPVVLVASGGSDRHALALEHQFRPLFGFFNAVTVPTAVYAVEADMEKTGEIRNPLLNARIDRAVAEALHILSARRRTRAAA